MYAEHRQRIETLQAVVQQQLDIAGDRYYSLSSRLGRLRLDREIQREIEFLNWKKQQLIQVTQQRSQKARQHCHLLAQKLASLDPHAVLKRGYAVVRQENGAIARSAAQLAPGQELLIQLSQGKIKVKVIENSQSEI